MKNSADLGEYYPPRPKAGVDNTLLDLQNSSYTTEPHSIIIAKYYYFIIIFFIYYRFIDSLCLVYMIYAIRCKSQFLEFHSAG